MIIFVVLGVDLVFVFFVKGYVFNKGSFGLSFFSFSFFFKGEKKGYNLSKLSAIIDLPSSR
jgi:hypothetical protein